MGLFQYSVLKNHLKFLPKDKLEIAWQKFVEHFHNPIIQENIRASKEEQYQEGFLNDLFVNVFGYVKNPNPSFNLTTELKNIKNAKKTDGALLRRGNAFAVIELKGMDTTDLSKVEAQVFGYKNNQPDCSYVIISNFEKLRFYIDNAVDFEEFNLFTLTKERFAVLYFCLSFETLLRDDKPKKAKEESINKEESITNALYKDYSNFRDDVFKNIQILNPKHDKLTLFKKTQKLLDRFLFIFFAEDKLLIPPNLINTIIEEWRDLAERHNIEMPLYEKYKLYFGYLNGGNKNHDIFPYNGGLFTADKLLDNLKIDDALLLRHTQKISLYDFDSEVSVNILGHIFEHSMNEFEEIQTEIEGKVFETQTTRRKKDGVFYTPKYITKYILDNTIGKICIDKKQELGLSEEILEKNYKIENGKPISNKKVSQEIKAKIESYKNWLLELTICDPACGSGAFLNQALEFLITEHHYIYELELKIIGTAIIDNDLENKILEKNIFGVDINEESVEIAKLSLWLRTAQRGRKLTTLNDNIKCGNSLIDDKEIAGEKAFNWKKEFPTVFKGKNKGFDVVVGNPPYRMIDSKVERVYFLEKYLAVEGRFDLFELFIEKSLGLLKQDAYLSFIIPNTILSNLYSKKLRQYIFDNFLLDEVVNFGLDVFDDPTVHTCILKIQNSKQENPIIHIRKEINDIEHLNLEYDYEILLSKLIENENLTLDISFSPNEQELINKIQKHPRLNQFCYIRQCIKTGDDTKYVKKIDTILEEPYKKSLRGKSISRYGTNERDLIIKYGDWLARNWKNTSFYETPKLAMRETGNRITATIDTENRYFLSSLYAIYPKEEFTKDYLKYLLTVLNSKIANFYIQKIAFDLTKGAFTKVRTNQLGRLPIPNISKESQEPFIDLANKMLSLNEEFSTKKSRFLSRLQNRYAFKKTTRKLELFYELDFRAFYAELEKQKITLSLFQQDDLQDYFEENKKVVLSLHNQIQAADNEIDKLVFELYGLTEDEVEIVRKS